LNNRPENSEISTYSDDQQSKMVINPAATNSGSISLAEAAFFVLNINETFSVQGMRQFKYIINNIWKYLYMLTVN